MIKATQLILFVIFFSISSLSGQNISKLLIENQWSAFDNFARVDFQENGQAILEYAYCSYCKDNRDTLDWSLFDKKLLLGKDSLLIQSSSKTEISTFQYGQKFLFKAVNKVKPSKLKKAAIKEFLVTDSPLNITVKSTLFTNSQSSKKDIQFAKNNKMWLGESKYRGQWSIKSFYGSIFLIYINRFSINRDFPLLKLHSLKKGKLTGQPIPSITQGSPFILVISEKK